MANNLFLSNTEYYLKEIKEIVRQNLCQITNGGFIVIQTQDVRINGYIEPLAKKIIDALTTSALWLKEIIVVIQKEQNSELQTSSGHLKINHQYLLVYEIKRY